MKWVALKGRAQDASQAELIAQILSVAAPAPMHIGQDNAATVSTLQQILRGDYPMRKGHLDLVPKADLVRCSRVLASAKGIRSLGSTRLQSHTVGEGADALWTFPADGKHNAIADRAARR